MKIHFERSGGFTGIPVIVEIDSQSLAEDEVQQLQDLIQAARFFELPAHPPEPSAAGADQFQYKITIEDGGQSHTIETTDGAAPDELRPLLRHLTLLARRR